MTCRMHCWEDDEGAPCLTCCHCKIQRVRYEENKPLVPITPQIRCACCQIKAPRKVVERHPSDMPGNLLGLEKAEQNDLNGWMLIVNPYKDVFISDHREGTDLQRFGMHFAEVLKICPKCALTVATTVVHLQKPALGEEDL